ncbi:hypothetical protein GTO91_16320 [Heliobacterium undosum]|uniref:SLH domain-containing protein n=1 Tax=Heliomicrobium undosum TaxID=121734 RepID=A0A845L4P7_9FIRM|nr:S-layer homology domain-containing protein [Heliomicrobium undosum]MZP31273.1 hypothetical protein [Heliomicrobium undosum]
MKYRVGPKAGALLLAGVVFFSGAVAPAVLPMITASPAWAGEKTSVPADARGHWAEAQIAEMVARGWIRGDEQGLFHPEKAMSRAEFVSLLVRVFEFQVVFIKAPDVRDVAADVPGDAWYAGDLIQAAHTFLALPDKAFHPEEELTREVMAEWVWAAYRHKGGNVDATSPLEEIPFSDNGAIEPAYRESVGAASAVGFIKGDEEGYFKPKATVTRAQAAVIVNRVAEKLSPRGESIPFTLHGRTDYGKWSTPRQAVLIRSEAEARTFAEQWRDTTLDMPVLSTDGIDFASQALIALIGFASSSSNPPQVTAMIRQGNTLTVYLEKKTGLIETADITGAYRYYRLSKSDVEGLEAVRAELRLVQVNH